jgi:hypothetical protein
MLLIHPPACRSTEAPLGIARLAGFLRANGVEVRCLDLNQEGFEWLLSLEADVTGAGTWTRRALSGRQRNASALRDPSTYASMGRYTRAVADLGKAVGHGAAAISPAVSLGLADYKDAGLSPLRKADLAKAARGFRESPFLELFERRIGESIGPGPGGTVGISVNFLSQALPALAIAGLVREIRPGARIFLGGGLITSWIMQGRLRADEGFGGSVDGLVAGRGEEALAGILGLAPPHAAAPPDFRDFSGLGYFSPAPILPYNFSIGCPYKRCSFCPERAEDSPYSGLPMTRARSELSALVGEGAPGLVHFTDNEIAPLYLHGLAKEGPGLPWYGFARFGPDLEDPAFCGRLAASGCRMLQLGLESGDQDVLDSLCKGTDLRGITRSLANLKEAGILVFLYVLFGTPAEDRDSALRTRDFVAAHADCVDFINIAVFNMPANSEEATGLSPMPFYEGDLSLYVGFEHPKGWNRSEVRAFLAKDFAAEASIRSIIQATPPVFTSNHAAFFGRRFSH